MEASGVSEILAKQLSYYGARSKVIASNIANIDTPGYKTKDIVSFKDTLNQEASKKQPTLQMKITHHGHIQPKVTKASSAAYSKVQVADLQEDNSGNNVDLDKQMAGHAKNNIAFNATKEALKKNNQLMKTVIESSVKIN